MLRDDLFEAIRELPSIDIHSHIDHKHLTSESIGDVIFYHMLQYPFRAAGIAHEKLWEEKQSFHGKGRPFEELDKHWYAVANTGFGWILKKILHNLYGFSGELTAESIKNLTVTHKQFTADPCWAPMHLLDCGVKKIFTSDDSDPLPPQSSPTIEFTIERSPEFGIYEFFSWKSRFERIEQFTGKHIESTRDLYDVNALQYSRFNWTNRKAVVWWVSSCADFRPVDDSVIDAIIARVWRGEILDLAAEGLLEAAYIRSVCATVKEYTHVFQLVYGTQFVSAGEAHPVQRAVPEFAGTLGHLFGEFPGLHFNILNGFEPDEPVLCSLCLGYPNVSLGSFWWQTFYPTVMHSGWHRRLDMVPVTRLMGFFSDAREIDWLLGRLWLTQHVLANVLAEKVDHGYYRFDQAVGVARAMLHDTPMEIFG